MNDPLQAQAIALFEAHVSTRDIAAQIGADRGDVKRWRAEWRGVKPSRTPARVRETPEDVQEDGKPDFEAQARARLEMTFIDWAEDKVVQCEMAIGALTYEVLNGGKVNAAGLAALLTRAREARDKVELIRQSMGIFSGSPEELREQMARSLNEWPDQYLELAFAVYSERNKGRVLFESVAGHKAYYDLEEGCWVRKT